MLKCVLFSKKLNAWLSHNYKILVSKIFIQKLIREADIKTSSHGYLGYKQSCAAEVLWAHNLGYRIYVF